MEHHDMPIITQNRNPLAMLDRLIDDDFGVWDSIDDALICTLEPEIGEVSTEVLADVVEQGRDMT